MGISNYISISQYSNMSPRLSEQTSIFDGVFFVSKFLLGIKKQKKRGVFSHVICGVKASEQLFRSP